MYGVVYHDQFHTPNLLVVEEHSIRVGKISDDEKVYEKLPAFMGEIVEIHSSQNQIVGLKSICALSLNKYGIRYERFWEGLETILADAPSTIPYLVKMGIKRQLHKDEEAKAEGAEVLIWPDGTFVMAIDYKPEHWAHAGDGYRRIWCSPNELRKMGLLTDQ